jgi:hypothetical protein
VSAPATRGTGPGAVTRQAGLRRRPAAQREFLLAACCYLLTALVVTMWLWRDPASRIVAGNTPDADQAAWWMRYAAQAVAHWRLPALFTTAMNTPAGVNAMWNSALLAPGVALSLVTLLFGPQVSLNVMLTVGFAGSATSLYWVLRQWRVGRFAAAAGGLVYGFSPALAQSSIGHYHIQFAVFPPLIVHLVARLVTGGSKPFRTGAALGLLAALQLLTGEELLFNTILAMAVGLLVAGISAVRSRPVAERARSFGAGIMAAAGVFVVIAGYPLWAQFAGPLVEHGSPFVIDFYKNDLEGLVQPSRLLLLHSAGSARFADQYDGGAPEYLGYLGWPLLFVLVWAAVTMWRMLAARVLAVTFLVLEVCALGGNLMVGGHVYGWLKLPWYWVEELPLATSAIVDRFSIIADGCAAALLALAIDAVWRSIPPDLAVRRRIAARAAILLATVITVVPMLPAPLPVVPVAGVPAGWAKALTDLRLPAGAGVLSVPVPTASFATPMRWQADTGLPSSLVGGAFIGPVQGGQAYVDAYGLSKTALYLNWLWEDSGTGPYNPAGLSEAGAVPPPAQAVAWIKSTQVSAVVAVTTPGSPLAEYLTSLLGAPTARSGDVLAWTIPPSYGSPG